MVASLTVALPHQDPGDSLRDRPDQGGAISELTITQDYVRLESLTGEKQTMSKVVFSYRDYSAETSRTGVHMEDPSGGAYDWASLAAAIDTVNDAIEGVSKCVRGPESITVTLATGSSATPTDSEAQRENGLRVFYQDQVNGRKGNFTIPGPDKSLMGIQGTDLVDWTGAEMAALESAIETHCLSRDGNAIQILYGKLIGRNN